MKVSVALCTYNSAAFLERLFESLLAQTRRPDEIIVFDDHSSDGTWRILSDLKANFPIAMEIFRNAENVGFAKNFSIALEKASGALVFPADHDDLWLPQKVEAFLAQANHDPAELFFSNSYLASEDLAITGDYWSAVGLSEKARAEVAEARGFSLLLQRGFIPGHGMAIRRSLLDVALPIPDGWPHDHWLSLMAASRGGIGVIPEPLVYYVAHARQAIGVRNTSVVHRMFSSLRRDLAENEFELQKMLALEDRLASISVPSRHRKQLTEKIEHCRTRSQFSRWLIPRVLQVTGEYMRGGYSRFENGFASAVKDILSR